VLFQGLQFANTAFWGVLALTRNKGFRLTGMAPVTRPT
jgi:hypothetical protein